MIQGEVESFIAKRKRERRRVGKWILDFLDPETSLYSVFHPYRSHPSNLRVLVRFYELKAELGLLYDTTALLRFMSFSSMLSIVIIVLWVIMKLYAFNWLRYHISRFSDNLDP